MNPTRRTLAASILTAIVVVFFGGDVSWAADNDLIRRPDEDVNSRSLRERSGLRPNESLLFNGWGVTPAGEHVPASDMPLKFVTAPDKKRFLAVSGGFNNHGVTLLDVANRKVTQFPLSSSSDSASTFQRPYADTGFNGLSSSQ